MFLVLWINFLLSVLFVLLLVPKKCFVFKKRELKKVLTQWNCERKKIHNVLYKRSFLPRSYFNSLLSAPPFDSTENPSDYNGVNEFLLLTTVFFCNAFVSEIRNANLNFNTDFDLTNLTDFFSNACRQNISTKVSKYFEHSKKHISASKFVFSAKKTDIKSNR